MAARSLARGRNVRAREFHAQYTRHVRKSDTFAKNVAVGGRIPSRARARAKPEIAHGAKSHRRRRCRTRSLKKHRGRLTRKDRGEEASVEKKASKKRPPGARRTRFTTLTCSPAVLRRTVGPRASFLLFFFLLLSLSRFRFFPPFNPPSSFSSASSYSSSFHFLGASGHFVCADAFSWIRTATNLLKYFRAKLFLRFPRSKIDIRVTRQRRENCIINVAH